MPLRMAGDGTARRGRDMGTEEARMDEDKVKRVTNLIMDLQKDEGVGEGEVRRLVADAYKVTDEDFGLRDAVAWGSDFRWPKEVFVRDWERIEKAGGLERAVEERHGEMSEDRLSVDRIDRWVRKGDDKARLKE